MPKSFPSRRRFLLGCSSAIAAMAGSRLLSLSFAADADPNKAPSPDILVALFLRGGMDGLNFVAPIDDAHYIAARAPAIRLVDQGDTAALPLSGGSKTADFRIHPPPPH